MRFEKPRGGDIFVESESQTVRSFDGATFTFPGEGMRARRSCSKDRARFSLT